MKKIILGLIFLAASHAIIAMNEESFLPLFYQMITEYQSSPTQDQIAALFEVFDNLPEDEKVVAEMYLTDANITRPTAARAAPRSITVEQSAAYRNFARAVEQFTEQTSVEGIREIVRLVFQIPEQSVERNDAASIMQGILAQYQDTGPLYIAADDELKRLHRERAEMVLSNIEGTQRAVAVHNSRNKHLEERLTRIDQATQLIGQETDQLTPEIQRLQAELNALESELRNMQAATASASDVDALEAELRALDEEIKKRS